LNAAALLTFSLFKLCSLVKELSTVCEAVSDTGGISGIEFI